MTKRLYNKNFIILLILCNSDKGFSSNFIYNLTQNMIGNFLNIVVPPIKGNETVNTQQQNNTRNDINNENNGAINTQNNKESQDKSDQRQINKIPISYPELIEEHYIWIAFIGTLLNHYKKNDEREENLPQINLEETIKTFFKESNKGETTVQKLSKFFETKSLTKNFITKDKTFIRVIGEYSTKFTQNALFNIILKLKDKLRGDDKKRIALFWMFTVALGRHAAEELYKKAKKFKEDNVFGEDYIQTNTLKYIEISFKERAILYKKLENMFLLFYQLAGKNEEDETFISKICKNMQNNIGEACFYKSFINLMYRNRNENEGYMDLVEAIRKF